ncbi:hypothetical protein ABZW03_24830, partial [Kitasatospora sp. NPDC004799]
AVEIGRLRVLGERYGNRLDRAVKKAWAGFTTAPKIRDCTWAADAAARYWPAVEAEFWKRLNARDFDGAAAAFRTLAEQAYDTVTYGVLGTMRGAKACTTARLELRRVLSRARLSGGGISGFPVRGPVAVRTIRSGPGRAVAGRWSRGMGRWSMSSGRCWPSWWSAVRRSGCGSVTPVAGGMP